MHIAMRIYAVLACLYLYLHCHWGSLTRFQYEDQLAWPCSSRRMPSVLACCDPRPVVTHFECLRPSRQSVAGGEEEEEGDPG